MDVHPPKNGINRYWSIPISVSIFWFFWVVTTKSVDLWFFTFFHPSHPRKTGHDPTQPCQTQRLDMWQTSFPPHQLAGKSSANEQVITLWLWKKWLLKMAIEIVDVPIKMVIFHSFLYVYQRVNGCFDGKIIYPLVNWHRPWKSPIFNGNSSSNPHLPGSMLIYQRVSMDINGGFSSAPSLNTRGYVWVKTCENIVSNGATQKPRLEVPLLWLWKT